LHGPFEQCTRLRCRMGGLVNLSISERCSRPLATAVLQEPIHVEMPEARRGWLAFPLIFVQGQEVPVKLKGLLHLKSPLPLKAKRIIRQQ